MALSQPPRFYRSTKMLAGPLHQALTPAWRADTMETTKTEPKPRDLATSEFTTIRLRLFKIAARVTETAGRVRLAFAAACPEADLFRSLANALIPQGP
jgi:hypothetical protein